MTQIWDRIARNEIWRMARSSERTLEEVRRDIFEAYQIGREQSNPEERKQWENIECEGTEPTAEEIVVHFLRQQPRYGR